MAAIVCLVTMIYYNREVALLFAAFMALGYLLPDDQGRRKDDAAELLEEAVRPSREHDARRQPILRDAKPAAASTWALPQPPDGNR